MRSILIATAAWGAAIVAFGFADTLWVALVLLAVAGGAEMLSGIFRMSIPNAVTPDRLRGRVAGIGLVVVSAGPALGNLEAGVVASLVGRIREDHAVRAFLVRSSPRTRSARRPSRRGRWRVRRRRS